MRTACVTLFYTISFFFSSSSSSTSFFFSFFLLILLLIHAADTNASEMELIVAETRMVWLKYPLSIFRFVEL
jgi:hypothetical protein